MHVRSVAETMPRTAAMGMPRWSGAGWARAVEVGSIGLGAMPMNWATSARRRGRSRTGAPSRPSIWVSRTSTADVYGPFMNEETVGRGLTARDEVVLRDEGEA
jgi:aryl-alcohol dehydrogenase-like predicted oxidoreductase